MVLMVSVVMVVVYGVVTVVEMVVGGTSGGYLKRWVVPGWDASNVVMLV